MPDSTAALFVGEDTVEFAGVATAPQGVSKDPPAPKSIPADELGVTAGLLFRNFVTGETVNVMPVSYSELRRITRQDGQARGLLRLLTMPIANAKWDILSSDEDNQVTTGKAKQSAVAGTTTSAERDFINTNLFMSYPEGGMSTPFSDIVASMALALRDGFRVYEKVFRLDDRGKIVLQKLAFRDNDSVTLLSDEHGDYNGFRQRCSFSGRFIDVTVDKYKSIIYAFASEENPLYGQSLFLPVYYHMDKKHKLYYISHIAYQILAIPPRIGTIAASSVDSKAVREKFLSDLSTLGFNAAMTIPEGFKVEPFESKRALADFIPLIDHHNSMAAKAVLGQFMDLTTSATGKLAGEQADVFVMGIVSVLKDIEKLFNNWIIPQLIDFNFSSRSYPKLRARAFTDSDQQALSAVFESIMTSTANHCSPQFIAALEKKMAGMLQIKNIDYAAVEQEMIDTAQEQRDLVSQQAKAAVNPPSPGGTASQRRPGKKPAPGSKGGKGEGNG